MLRQSVVRSLRGTTNQTLFAARRPFSVAAVRMGEGDTGAPRIHPDQFTRREAAQENLYVREKELEKLRALKEKLKEQRKHLDELDKHIDQLTREQGGEQN
ncbi:hypothetical protein VTN31DRAFT_403 [Thermomyces dupontii]|uniref:uncharacterized protein n=1 Tax=Talaromyces thermophilus TaxID=28565 RepID=UPI003743DEB0